jgi:hypothetical protein
VAQLHSGVVAAKMEEWYRGTNNPTWYCSWKNEADENLLSLSVSFATSNPSYEILKTYSQGSRVVEVPEVGTDAAVMFYAGKHEASKRLTMLARNHKWTLDVRSSISGDEDGEQFEVLTGLVSRIFSRLDTDETFSRLEK